MQKKQALLMNSVSGGTNLDSTITVGYCDGTDGAFYPIKKIGILENGKAFNYTVVENAFDNIGSLGSELFRWTFFSDATKEYDRYRKSFSLHFPKLTTIGEYGLYYAFRGCTALTSVSFPELSSVSSYGLNCAFYECTGLTGTVSFPKLSSLSSYGLNYAFYKCTGLTSVDFPELTSISVAGLNYAFKDCTGLTGSVSFPEVTTIDEIGLNYAFYGCSRLTGTVSFPKLTTIGYQGSHYAFYGCRRLTSVSFPELSSVGTLGLYYAFVGCTGLTGSVSFPKLTTINEKGLSYAFSSCTGLTSVSFPELTTIGYQGLENAFRYCTGLTSVSFPKLSSLSSYGLSYTFRDCTGLTSVSFPKLTTVGQYGLSYPFYGCTNLKEVHFHYSLEGNSQCTASTMGCSNATIYFDLGRAKYTITNIDTTATYIFNGEKIDTSTVSYGYVIPNKANTILAYKPNYCLYIENLTPTDETPIEKAINFTTDGATYSITLNGVSGVTPSTTFSYNGCEIVIEGTNPSIIVPEGTEISYVVKAKGYRTIRGTLNSSSSSQTFTMEVQTSVTYDLSYPFTDYPDVLTNLVDGSNFEIAETPTVYSGSGIQSSIINGSKSFKVNNGVSYGYIKFHTPDTTDTDLLTVSITCTAYTENATYDCAFAFVNTQLNTITTRTSSVSQGTNSTYGYVLYSNKSYNGSTYNTYTYTLQANTDYYLQFAYTKDSSSHSGWDRFSITNIKFTDEGTY